MLELDKIIEQKTGLTIEKAMRLDKANLYSKLGEATIWKLSKTFYSKVFNDDEQKWFKNIFKGKNQEDAIQNQAEFFIQRLGGPSYFSQRKGHPALIARHMSFNMGEKAAERWLHHMRESLSEVEEIDEDTKAILMDYFTHTAYFLSVGVTMRQKTNRDQE